jgi:O-antigen ligase
MLLTPLVRWAKPKFQLRVAVLLAIVALTYPATRMLQIFPVNTIVDIAESLGPERAGSLKFRFDQEDELLKRAFERPLFGWGRYGRNRIYAENWNGESVDTTVTDGRWIITFGQFGVVGFLLEFGLLAFPVFKAAAAIGKIATGREAIAMAAIALIVAINMIELLPNSTLGPWTWLMAGCLLGSSEAVVALARSRNFVSSRSTGADASGVLAR